MYPVLTSRVDEVMGSGYIDLMEKGMRYVAHRPRHFRPGWLITLCWLLPLMVGVAACGYVLAQWKLEKTMSKSLVQPDKPHPKPLLPPDQASKIAKDEASPVWTEGVNSADVPKLDPNDYAAERAKNYVFPGHHRHGLRYHHGPKAVTTDKGEADSAGAAAPTDAGDQVPSTSPVDPPPTADKGVN